MNDSIHYLNELAVLMLILFGLLIQSDSYAQVRDSSEMADYKERIQQAYLNGYYIPKDIQDAMRHLVEISSEEGLEKFKQAPEDTVAQRLHFGLGKWILVNWNLVEGSRYSHYLRQLGLTFPTDMVDFTIVSLHRYLHDKPLNIEERVAEFVEERKEEHRMRTKDAKVIYRDTLPAPDSTRSKG